MALFSSKGYDRERILGEAERLRARGRVKKAIRAYLRILEADPEDVSIHAKLAPLFQRVRRNEEARTSYRKVIDWYHARGFIDKELATLRMFLGLDPQDLSSHFRMTDLYLEKKLPGDALRGLERARKAFRRRRHRSERIAVEERYLTIDPEAFAIQRSLVHLLRKAGRSDDALAQLLRMEDQWARKPHRSRWRKTRWLVFRHRSSLGTFGHWLAAVFVSPRPLTTAQQAHLAR